ncbi:MAG: glycosyltransferase family 39 protein, partial [candidate division WOR-3 bacterium]
MHSRRILSAAFGLLFLAGAVLASYNPRWLNSYDWRVYFTLPGFGEHSLPIWLVSFGLPALLLLFGLRSRPFRQALAVPWRSPRTALRLLIAVIFILTATCIPWEFFWYHQTVGDTTLSMVLGLTGTILLASALYHQLAFLDPPVKRCYRWVMSLKPGIFLIFAGAAMLVITNLIALFAFRHAPYSIDTADQLFQARIFASGRLYLPVPEFPDFFECDHMVLDQRWYSQFPYLHPLLLAGGVLLGTPWLVNPVLGTLFVIVLYALGRELYDEPTARLAALLAVLSPFVVNMASEFMNHVSALQLITLFLLGFFRTLRTGRKTDAVLAGLALGLAAGSRPFTALAIAIPFAAYSLLTLVREPRRYWSAFLTMLLTTVGATTVLLLYNHLTTGNALVFGYVARYGPGHEVGLGRSAWGYAHTLGSGLLNSGRELGSLNRLLFGWFLPSLLPLTVLLAHGLRDRRDWLLFLGWLALLGAYIFYWYHSRLFGPRYQYEAAGALILLTVQGIMLLGAVLRRLFRLNITDRQALVLVGRIAPWQLLALLLVIWPRLLTADRVPFGDTAAVRSLQRQQVSNALVFCNEFGSGLNANPLNLEGALIFARDCGALNPALTIRYPGRKIYRVHRDSILELPPMEFATSRLRAALDSLTSWLKDSLKPGYRTIIWPLRELAPGGLPITVTDFRTVSRKDQAGTQQWDELLPALACWVVGDRRELLW